MAAVLEAPGPPGSGLNEQMVAMEKWMQRILDNKGVPPLMISRLETADYPSADAPKQATPTFEGRPPDHRSQWQSDGFGPPGEMRRSWASARPSRAPSPQEAQRASCSSQSRLQACRPRGGTDNGVHLQEGKDASLCSSGPTASTADTSQGTPLGPRLYPRQRDGHVSQSTSVPPTECRAPFRPGSRLPSPGRLSPGQMSPVPLEESARRGAGVPGTPIRREVLAAEVRSRPQYPGYYADRGPPTPGANSSHAMQPSGIASQGMYRSRDPSLAMPRAEYLSAPPPQAQPRKPLVQGTSPSARLLGKEGEPSRIRLAPRPHPVASQPATPYGSHVAKPFFQVSPRQTASTTPTAGRRDILSASTRHMAPPVTTPPAAATAKKDALGGSTRNRPRVVGGLCPSQLPERSPASVQTVHGPQQANSDTRRAAAGVQHRLQVFIAEGKIETAIFSNESDVAVVSETFLNAHGLKQAVQAGLQAKMESMIMNKETDAYIDLVDLL